MFSRLEKALAFNELQPCDGSVGSFYRLKDTMGFIEKQE